MPTSEVRWSQAFHRAAFVITTVAMAAGFGACPSDDNSNHGSAPPGSGAGRGGSGGTGGSGASCASPGGADTSHGANTHCKDDKGKLVTQATGMCVVGGDEDAGTDTEDMPDAGPLSSVLGGDYGETNYGSEAFDDDCKYKVSWKSTPICDNANVTFTVTIADTVDDGAVTGAKPYLEVFKIDGDSVHFPAATNQVSTEKGKGVYDVGPVKFNASGQWIVRFHLFEECADSEDSPHGHAAFYVTVP